MNARSAIARLGFGLATVILAGCSGGGSGPGGGRITTAPDVVYTIPGPYSPAYTPAGGTAFTATQVKLTYLGFPGIPGGQPYESLRIDVTFDRDISSALPPPGTYLTNGSQLGVYVGLDVDDNPSTGTSGIGCENFPGSSSTGDEFFIDPGTDFGRLSDGNFSLVKTTETMGAGGDGEVATSIVGNRLTEVVTLASLANYTSIPRIGIYLEIVNGNAPGYTGILPIGTCIPEQGEFVTGS